MLPTEELTVRIILLILLVTRTHVQQLTSEDDLTSGCGNDGHLAFWNITDYSTWRELTSHPGYSTHAPMPNRTCAWTVTPPSGKYVALELSDMTNLECRQSLLITALLRDGGRPSWMPCRETDPSSLSLPFHMGGQVGEDVVVYYKGAIDPAKTYLGFRLRFSFREPGCRVQEDLTGADKNRMWFSSHLGLGLWAPEAKANCVWYILAPAGHYISLTATYIWLHCINKWQQIEIYDGGKALEKNRLVTLTCTRQMAPYASTGRRMRITYTDSWAGAALGFNISYNFHKAQQSGCGSQFLHTGKKGEISSQNSKSAKNKVFSQSRCKWKIQLEKGQTISFRVTSFQLWGDEDYLFLSYGNYTQRFTMETPPDLIHRLVHTGSHIVHVTLYIGSYGMNGEEQGTGFRLLYASDDLLKQPESSLENVILGVLVFIIIYWISVRQRYNGRIFIIHTVYTKALRRMPKKLYIFILFCLALLFTILLFGGHFRIK